MPETLIPAFDRRGAATAIARMLAVSPTQVERTMALFDEGATIPFIARYRKEATSGLDEVQIAGIEEEHERLAKLHERKEHVLKTIDEAGKLDRQLQSKIVTTETLLALEDLYLPYKPRKRTRGQKARDAGFELLVEALKADDEATATRLLEELVSKDFPDKGAKLGAARDIIAEELSEKAPLRESLRKEVIAHAKFATKAKKDGDPEGKFESFVGIQDRQATMPSHRILGMLRAEKEGAISVKLGTDDERAEIASERMLPHVRSEKIRDQFALVAQDAWKRLLKPSLESELRRELKEFADGEAIDVFAQNLRKVLLRAPLGEHAIIGIDPGFRTGCKVALVDPQGDFVTNTTIYPHPPQNKGQDAEETLESMITHFEKQFPVAYFAYGNGTASRETGDFLAKYIRRSGRTMEAIEVSESGASIYSASEIAREEFPDIDLTVRGAISIARRLQDPLAELIKVDAKSIGVGQYQHDVDQKRLAKGLDRVVESCVNTVGVDLNTASWALLRYVSGISPRLAKAIVEYRHKIGRFSSRKELLKVSGLGAKAYELSAGFLRIRGGDNLLDNTAVHPERYDLVGSICRKASVELKTLVSDSSVLDALNARDFIDEGKGVGLPTIQDIFEELRRPGRDPRGKYEKFEYDPRVHEVADLVEGMDLPGIVTNVTNFGCFVDVGVHQDGLVHISELDITFVKDPAQVVSVGDRVKVRVLEVDTKRSRIALSRKALL